MATVPLEQVDGASSDHTEKSLKHKPKSRIAASGQAEHKRNPKDEEPLPPRTFAEDYNMIMTQMRLNARMTKDQEKLERDREKAKERNKKKERGRTKEK